jgi:hypothetical protein
MDTRTVFGGSVTSKGMPAFLADACDRE